MTHPFSIRRYAPADLPACATLFEQVMHETFPEDDPATYAVATFTSHTAGETVWVAQAGDRIVGLASLWPGEPFLHFLLVLANWRGRGIGTALMEAAMREIEGPVDLKCRMGNAAAQRFYEARGWREVGRDLTDAEPYIRYRR